MVYPVNTDLASAETEGRTSASQVETFGKCERAWYFGSVLRVPRVSTAAQGLGTNVHGVIERWLNGHRDTIDPAVARLVDAAKPYLPDPEKDAGTYIAEGEFRLPTYQGGPVWLGFIDLKFPGEKPPRILDYKTTSDFRYAKTEAELLENTQVMSYARRALDLPESPDVVKVGHLYIRTKGAAKALPVYVEASKGHVLSIWERDLQTVRRMEAIRRQPSLNPDDVPPTGTDTGHCNAYGGCPYREKCGLENHTSIFGGRKMTDNTVKPSALLEKVLAAKAKLAEETARKAQAAGTVPTTPAPAQEAPAPEAAPGTVAPGTMVYLETAPPVTVAPTANIVPPDAPPRTEEPEPVRTPEPEAQAATPAPEAPAKRKPGRPPKSAAQITLPGVTRCPACKAPITLENGTIPNHNGVDANFKPDDMAPCVTAGDALDGATAWVEGRRIALADRARDTRTPPPAEDFPAMVARAESNRRAREALAKVEADLATAKEIANKHAAHAADLERRLEASEKARQAALAAIPHPKDAAKAAAPGFTLYIDCTPIKGADRAEVVLLEDWLAPIAQAVAEHAGKPDYRLIQYTSKGDLAIAMREARKLPDMPRVLQISSLIPGADVAIEVLTPWATQVIRKC